MKRLTKAHEKAGVMPALPRPQFRQQLPSLSFAEQLKALDVQIGMTQRALGDGEYTEPETCGEAAYYQQQLEVIRALLQSLRAQL